MLGPQIEETTFSRSPCLTRMGQFFPLCPEDQREMFPVFRKHAAPKAVLMFTSGPAYGEAIGTYVESICIMAV